MIHVHGFIGRRSKEGEVGESEGVFAPPLLKKLLNLWFINKKLNNNNR